MTIPFFQSVLAIDYSAPFYYELVGVAANAAYDCSCRRIIFDQLALRTAKG